tara:strand:+ start:1832 stop:2548 length:717 start_codon:yes stop_codon:yes gene_type:complete
MAGGIFVNQPFHPNIKCIVFSIILMLGYWTLPKKNPFMLPLIFVIAYVSMAWYDHMYDCDMKMYGGKYGGYLSSPFKPQRRENNEKNDEGDNNIKEDKDLLKNQESKYRQKVNLLHILAINPVLIYVGIYGNKSNSMIYSLILGISLITLGYHGMRMFVDREVTNCPKEKKEEVKTEISYLKSVYIMHVAAIVPLLLYVGIKGNDSDVRVFPILLALGIVSDIYHGFRVFYPRPTINC